MSRKPGVGAHQWATSNPCVGEGVLVGAVFIGQLHGQPQVDKSAPGSLKGEEAVQQPPLARMV